MLTDFGFYGKYVVSAQPNMQVSTMMLPIAEHLRYSKIHKQRLAQRLMLVQQDMLQQI
jgi:hypothetical protein